LNNTTATLSDGDDEFTVPTGALNIREVWIDSDRKENVDQMLLFYKRQFRLSETGEFSFWSHLGDTVGVDVEADDDYTITVFYDKASTPITASGNSTPYEGRFDNTLREAVVLLCESKKYKQPSEADAAYAKIFERIVHMDLVNRKFVKKTYRLNF